MFHTAFIRAALWLGAATLVTFGGGCVPQDLLTDPCEEDCNDEARVGDPCGAAEDCATGSYCN
ncbi:MAG: hypothetical protein AAFS10_12745, partial [Myxococcota bacterium]